MATPKKLKRQIARAERLGVLPEIADLLGHYLDAVEEAEASFVAFHWGDRSEHTQVHSHPLVVPVMYELGELVEVTYETAKGGEAYHWQHSFSGDRPVLAYGGNNLWILGGSYTVNRRGIVG